MKEPHASTDATSPAPGAPDASTPARGAAGVSAPPVPGPDIAIVDAPMPDALRDDQIAQQVDLALIEQARSGVLEAFNQLVLRHQDHLFGLVYRLVPDGEQAADVVQEAFFSAYRNLAAFRGGSVRGWLSRIAINGAMDLQRARRRRPSQPYPELEDESWQPPANEATDPELLATGAERSHVLAAALARIAPDQRAAIVLYDVQGYDYAEIASLTRVSVGTVKSRIHRGRRALRDLLAPSRELFRG